MKQLKRTALNSRSCFVVGIILGIIIGIAAFNIVVSYRMDQFYKRIAYLEQTIQDKNAVLEKLEKNINTWNHIIKGIEVVLLFNGDEIDKINIEKSIKSKYSILLGKEVNGIDPELIIEVVDQRIMKLNDKEYKLKVNKLIVTEILKISINVEPIT